jgi:hypothetical protein
LRTNIPDFAPIQLSDYAEMTPTGLKITTDSWLPPRRVNDFSPLINVVETSIVRVVEQLLSNPDATGQQASHIVSESFWDYTYGNNAIPMRNCAKILLIVRHLIGNVPTSDDERVFCAFVDIYLSYLISGTYKELIKRPPLTLQGKESHAGRPSMDALPWPGDVGHRVLPFTSFVAALNFCPGSDLLVFRDTVVVTLGPPSKLPIEVRLNYPGTVDLINFIKDCRLKYGLPNEKESSIGGILKSTPERLSIRRYGHQFNVQARASEELEAFWVIRPLWNSERSHSDQVADYERHV